VQRVGSLSQMRADEYCFSGQISKGVTKTFTSGEQLNLKVGNAGGVDLSVNGTRLTN